MHAGLTERIEANVVEHACHLHRHTEGMTVTETDDLVIADSGIEGDASTGADTFNIVANARFAPDEVKDRLYRTVFKLRLTGRAFSWSAGPNSADLPFGSVELTAGRREAAMWAPAADIPVADRLPDLEIRRVRTPEELADYARILAANRNPPAVAVAEFYDRVASSALAEDCPAHYLLGYHHGAPVSAGEVFLHAGVAGIYNISTLAAFRRRGFGGVMTSAAIDSARAAGYDTVALRASAESEPAYRQLGFRADGWFTEYPVPIVSLEDRGYTTREQLISIGFEHVHVENERYDGPQAGVADISGVPHYFLRLNNFFEDGDEFSVWPIDDEGLALEQEAWRLHVKAWDAGECEPARFNELESLLEARRTTPPAIARTMFAQWRFDERDARHDDSGPTYLMRWR
ncbi:MULTISPECIES: GNAT family N-acetyltransferase [unclassified Amycolatopsis]|uniref:GNAT family N-acetyltransferase n=1 Tax=unclassified Amycolatopsis TaxID=2618356 RepID=UPI00287B7B13|nr:MULTISPECIES: GNAT family N-acetyltransferase [unclassified Amycolatopsis]